LSFRPFLVVAPLPCLTSFFNRPSISWPDLSCLAVLP
jgi:hypothetical protein